MVKLGRIRQIKARISRTKRTPDWNVMGVPGLGTTCYVWLSLLQLGFEMGGRHSEGTRTSEEGIIGGRKNGHHWLKYFERTTRSSKRKDRI